MYSSKENIRHEENKETQEKNKVTTPTHYDMLKAFETLGKGLLFCNADKWSLLSKLDHAVDQATKNDVKQSNINQFFCVEEGQE